MLAYRMQHVPGVRPPRPGLLPLSACLFALWAAPVHAQQLRSAASPDEVLEKTAAVPTEEPAPPSDHHVRLKLSLEGFSSGTTWGMPVWLTGLHLETNPLSRRGGRLGLGLTGGLGNAALDGASASAVYGLFGVSLGVQYPARVTPFVEGHAAGGFMTAKLDRPVMIGTVTVRDASGTTWLVTRGLDAGAEMYVFGRAYLSFSLGWMRSTWASPDYNPNAPAANQNLRITTVTADSMLRKVGLGN